jgi:hypothetical protein
MNKEIPSPVVAMDRSEDLVSADLIMAMARRADNPALERRRRSPSAWRIWSDGEVTTDGMPTLCRIIDGASELGLQFPRRVADGSSYAVVTRRDAVVIHNEIARLVGCTWSIRLRSSAGAVDEEDRLPWSWPQETDRDAESILFDVDRLRDFVAIGRFDVTTRAVRGLLLSHDLGIAVPASERALVEQYADLCVQSGDPRIGSAIVSVLSSLDGNGYCRSASVALDCDGSGPDGIAAVPPGIAAGWRKEPPTVDEVRACAWWWVRERDGYSHVLQLDIDPGSGAIVVVDVVEATSNDCGGRFDSSDWPGEWSPCLPPSADLGR